MKKREVSKVIISPEYAYGSAGLDTRVPADETVTFEVELFDWVVPERPAWEMTSTERLIAAEKAKNLGTDHFKVNIARNMTHPPLKYDFPAQGGKLDDAVKEYSKAATILEQDNSDDDVFSSPLAAC